MRPTFPRLAALTLLVPALGACSAFGYPSPFTPAPAAAPGDTGGTLDAPDPGAASSATSADAPAADASSTYEVFGVRYATLPSSDGYREVGVASWYGEKFEGRPTASGEPYDMHDLTAAHRSLPLGTCVEVERLDTGAAVVVRVNDRGPFARTESRIIDLSWEAARRLDMIATGTAEVEVRALDATPC